MEKGFVRSEYIFFTIIIVCFVWALSVFSLLLGSRLKSAVYVFQKIICLFSFFYFCILIGDGQIVPTFRERDIYMCFNESSFIVCIIVLLFVCFFVSTLNIQSPANARFKLAFLMKLLLFSTDFKSFSFSDTLSLSGCGIRWTSLFCITQTGRRCGPGRSAGLVLYKHSLWLQPLYTGASTGGGSGDKQVSQVITIQAYINKHNPDFHKLDF